MATEEMEILVMKDRDTTDKRKLRDAGWQQIPLQKSFKGVYYVSIVMTNDIENVVTRTEKYF